MSIDETMYRLTVAQRDAAWREVEAWKRRYDELAKMLANHAALQRPPLMLGDKESYEAGKAMAFNEAKYTIGVDTSEGFHTLVVYRLLPGQPTTLVATARLTAPEGDDWK